MFAAEFELADRTDRRRSVRAPVSFDSKVGRGGLGRALCKVIHLTAHGARLQTYTGLQRGSSIWLTLPAIGYVVADVIWSDDFIAGCEFHTPLTMGQYETVLAFDA
jgi:hypothetical protein